MAFKRFVETGRGTKPMVSIWKRGQIGFNSLAVQKYKLDQFTHVIFFYDDEQQKIGLRFTNNSEEEGVVKLNVRKNNVVVNAGRFLEMKDISYNPGTKFNLAYDEKEDLYVVDINAPVKKRD